MKFRNWELALIGAIAVALLFSSALAREQAELSAKLIRLHVVANSDNEYDQAVKLRVRDAVLSELAPHLESADSADDAAAIVESNFHLIRTAAESELRASGYNYSVGVSLGREDFPTREYDTFSLPAGEYTALRIELGEAAGRNWWCVVYPPLCTEAASSASSALEAFSDDEIRLIGEDDGYVVRFKCMEILAGVRKLFS